MEEQLKEIYELIKENVESIDIDEFVCYIKKELEKEKATIYQ